MFSGLIQGHKKLLGQIKKSVKNTLTKIFTPSFKVKKLGAIFMRNFCAAAFAKTCILISACCACVPSTTKFFAYVLFMNRPQLIIRTATKKHIIAIFMINCIYGRFKTFSLSSASTANIVVKIIIRK